MPRKNNKRCHDSLSSSPRLTPSQRFRKCSKRNDFGTREKNEKSVVVDEGIACTRWQDMDHDVLVHIMKRFPWNRWGCTNFIICKSWLSAFLDALFPPGDTLDLRLLDGHSEYITVSKFRIFGWHMTWFFRYLRLDLDRRPPDSYTKLILPDCYFEQRAYRFLARRLPSLKTLVCPEKMSPVQKSHHNRSPPNYVGHVRVASYMCAMPNLESVCCHVIVACTFGRYCKFIRSLTLMGKDYRFVNDVGASYIAKGFPLLDHLNISWLSFTVSGLSMILDSHKNLQYLDLQHTMIQDAALKWISSMTPNESPWPEEISKRIAGVKTLVTCPGISCATCKSYYLEVQPR